MLLRTLPIVFLALALPAAALDLDDATVAASAEHIREDGIRASMRFLADDLLEGREAGTRGYDVAAHYMAAQLEALGIEPGGEAGSFFQSVPFRASRTLEDRSSMELVRDGQTVRLVSGEDYLLGANFYAPAVKVEDAPVVFVGYGVTAPEYRYDDYAGMDVKGKVVVTLKGAPPALPNDPRAYYSSSTVKAQTATARGAIGIIQVLSPEDWRMSPWSRLVDRKDEIGLRWSRDGVISNSFEQIRVRPLLSESGAAKLFAGAKKPLNAVFETARSSRTQSFVMPWRVRIVQRNELNEVSSPNVVGVLRGSDPSLAGEYVVYTAHLDHEGKGSEVRGDSIYNGAYDNASGCAVMLEVARAFAEMPVRPRRSILFLAVTAEEKGLQGAEYFVHYPVVPIESIVANLNMDMFLALFPVAEVVGFGAEHSSLGKVLETAAAKSGFKVIPDFAPQEVVFIRSDQFPFVKKGVPALFATNGIGSLDPSIDGRKTVFDWMMKVYHGRGDDLSQPIHYPSLARFARLNFYTGLLVSEQVGRPTWNKGDFFAAKFSRH